MSKQEKSKYTFLWSDYQPHMTVQMNINSFIKFPEIAWNNTKNIIQISRNNNISTFHSNRDLAKDKERGKMYFKKGFAQKIINIMEKGYRGHWNMFQRIQKMDFSKLSEKELFKHLVEIADRWSYIISFFRISQAEGTHYLVEKIKKYVSPEEASLLMLSPKLDAVNLEQLDWQALVKKPFSKKRILQHAAKYPWLVMCHYQYEDVIETLKQKYDHDKKHLIPKDIKREKQELKKKQTTILKKHLEIEPPVKLAQRLALSRIEVKSCWAGTDFYQIPLFVETAKRTGENLGDLWKYYLIEEISDLLFKGRRLSPTEKRARKDCFVGLWKNGRASYYSGKKAKQIAKKELGEIYKIKPTNELKGMAANPGKTTGVARIMDANNVEQTRQLRKDFKKGQILITQMTQPNVMDIASKAGALVTDEGGMLSHAAIISRELGIPCIVGTKNATKVFRDGQTIEVDADRGIVKIIKTGNN